MSRLMKQSAMRNMPETLMDGLSMQVQQLVSSAVCARLELSGLGQVYSTSFVQSESACKIALLQANPF